MTPRRSSRWTEGWSSVGRDIRSGIRQWRGAPALGAVLVVTLGIGLGLTVAVFSIIHAVLLRPLPYADYDRLVAVFETLRDIKTGRASVGHFHDWTEQAKVFDATAALQPTTFNLSGDPYPERVTASRVTPGFFDVLRIPPRLGRYFTASDVRESVRLVVLSSQLWEQRFGSDPTIVGREVRLNNEPYTVVAVADPEYAIAGGPRSTAAGLSPAVWTPLTFTPAERANFGNHASLVLGRLKPGIAKVAAQQDLERVTRSIARAHPQQMAARGVNVVALDDMLVGNARTQLYFLLGAVAAVVLIGAVNVTSVLLARAAGRRREMAIRSALGAGRLRIARQVLIESLVIATAGGALALVVGNYATRALVALGPGGLARLSQAWLSPVVILFAIAVTLSVGLVFGLIPAMRAAGSALRSRLDGGGRHSTTTGHDRVRSVLVVAELALTAILIVAAGLLMRSAYAMQQVPVGFDPDRVAAGRVILPADQYRDPAAVAAAFDAIVTRLRGTPGIDAAGASTTIPFTGGRIDAGLRVEGTTYPSGSEPSAQVTLVSDGYVEAQGLTVRRGRSFVAADMSPDAAPVVLINERLAASLWPGEDPVGKRLSTWAAVQGVPEWRQVAGVIGDTHGVGLTAPVAPEIYIPYGQAPQGAWDVFQRSMNVVFRAGDPERFIDALRRSVRDVNPSLAVFDISTAGEDVRRDGQGRRLNMLLLSMIATIALALATVGIYGLIAFFVAERTPEIGLRIALGATGGNVLAIVLRRGLWLTVTGLTLGLGGAWALSHVLSALVFEITPTDGPTYAGGALVVVLTALIATAIPAWRATRIDPVRALTK